MSLTVMCQKKQSYQIQAKPPLFSFQVEEACEVFADELTLPPFYHRESHYDLLEQKEQILKLQDPLQFSLWTPIEALHNSSQAAKIELPDLGEVQDVPIDTLVEQLNKIPKLKPLKSGNLWDQIWEYLEYVLIFIVCSGIVALVFWLKCKRKLRPLINETAMGNCVIGKIGTDQKTGQDDVENAKSTSRADDQSMEIAPAKESSSSKGTLMLQLAGHAP